MFIYYFLLSLIGVGILSSAYFIFCLLLTILAYVLYGLGAYRMFQKAGKPGYLAWIPIVNEYIAYTIAWNTSSFAVTFVSEIISSFSKNGHKTFMARLASIVVFVWKFLFTQKLAKAFGKSELFGLGLFLFEPIFIMILGFSDAFYYGPQE